MKSFFSTSISTLLIVGLAVNPALVQAVQAPAAVTPATPIQHLVIIFGENISFDHYFGTYPTAANPPGEPPFHAASGTPAVNGLTPALLTNNPNYVNTSNGSGAANPFRLDRSQALTADMNHSYGPEQQAFDHGAMDLFPLNTGSAGAPPNYYPPVIFTKGLVMGYYDGNTVTAMWNYAQNFALNDNTYTSTFGPSTPGALEVISGQTNGITATLNGPSSAEVSDGNGGETLVGDGDPLNDACSGTNKFQVQLGNTKNIGDLLTAAGVTWGGFMGGFNLTTVNSNGSTGCNRTTVSPFTGLTETDYVPHHAWFQYSLTTSNPQHTRPTSTAAIGTNADAANHQYDINDFYAALAAGNLPAVSYLKAASYEDAHPGNSNPLDEQQFIVHVLNLLQQSTFWSSTTVIITYDDSDGWYDHQMPSIVNGSTSSQDYLTSTGVCGTGTPSLNGVSGKPANGRCGYGTRIPLLVISPYAKPNYVDSTLLDQSSVVRFIEDNWLNSQRLPSGSFDAIAGSIMSMFNFSQTPNPALILSETTGTVQH